MNFKTRFQVFTSGESRPTKITLIWLLPTMRELVSADLHSERNLLHNITLIWLLTCVGNIILIKDFISSKFPLTYVTFVCLHPQTTQRVNSESSTQRKLFVTNVTLMTLTFGMYMAVTLQIHFRCKLLNT